MARLMGRHGILIFSCLLFVLFEMRKPDIFVWYLSLCHTMDSLVSFCLILEILVLTYIEKYCSFYSILNAFKNFNIAIFQPSLFAFFFLLTIDILRQIHELLEFPQTEISIFILIRQLHHWVPSCNLKKLITIS